MPSTTVNMNSVDKVDGDDITAAERNNIRKDLKLGIRDRRINDDGATITFDLSITNVHEVTLAGNRILALSNIKKGQHFRIELIQDGTGGRTVTWFTTINWVNNSAPVLTTTAGRKDVFVFYCKDDDGTPVFDGYVAGQNIVA